MGIQINGQTDTISATDGSFTIQGATLPTAEVTNLNATGIVTAIGFVGNVAGNLNSTGVSTFSNGPVLIGSGTSTGTASQRLQVTGGAYVSGSLSIGTTIPGGILHVNSNDNANTFIASGSNGRLRVFGHSSSFGGPWISATNPAESSYLPLFLTGSDVVFAPAGTDRARIDGSGRFLVGSSTNYSGYKLQVVHTDSSGVLLGCFNGGTNYLSTLSSNGSEASRTIVTNGQNLFTINATGYDGSANRTAATISAIVDGTPGANEMPGRLVFSTNAATSSPTERMRITKSGFTKYTNTADYHDANGNYHETRSSIGDWTHYLTNTHGSTPQGTIIRFPSVSPNNTSSYFHFCIDSTTPRFYVYSNGGIANYQSNNTNLCDEREKKNIEALDSTWGCLKNWDLKKFHYNEDADTDDKRYGVIAQQVAPHCPEVITEWVKQKAEDAVLDEDGNVVTPAVEEVTRMGVKEQQMMWMAIKALQEAQTRIETLEAEVAALKGA